MTSECYRCRDAAAQIEMTHGESKNGKCSPEYIAYRGAKARCNIPLNNHKNYNGRGIKFLFTSFAEFLSEIGRKPSPSHSLDRKDNNGNYEIGNIKWSTKSEQPRNRRSTQTLTVDGVSKALTEWEGVSPVNRQAIIARRGRGWCDSCAIFVKRKGQAKRCPHKINAKVR